MVDIKCTFPKNKIRKPEKTACSENQGDDDESLLRQPIGKFSSGFKEAKNAYENGTDEVRRLLIQGCCLIYECNVCRNLFRNLANFIWHKRKYCTGKTAEDLYNFSEPGSNLFIQTVEGPKEYPVETRSTESSSITKNKPSNHVISTVIERLKRVEVSKNASSEQNIPIDRENKISSSEPKAPDPSLTPECASTTSQGVYQHAKLRDGCSVKTELEESELDESISPLLTSLTASNDRKENDLPQYLPNIFCEICKMQFETEKTLKTHVEKSHTSTTYVFQCPTCAMTFLQPAAVIRHLANEHRKPLRRIRKMREAILKKRVQIGDTQVNRVDKKAKRFQLDNTKEKYASIAIDQPNGRQLSFCSFCSRSFERRSELTAHLKKCLARNVQQNKIELYKSISIPNSKKEENQILNEQQEHNKKDNTIFSAEMALNIKQEPQEDENSTHVDVANSNTINKMFENLENQTFGNGLHTVCLENIELMVETNENSIEEHKIPNEQTLLDDNCRSNEINQKNICGRDSLIRNKPSIKGKSKKFHVVSTSKQLPCRCKICNKQFTALSNLRRHISMFHYRSKRFGCNLCDYRAFRRYDIVNHLTYIHKMTGERESMAVEYVTVHEIESSKNDVEGDIVLINEETTANEHNKRNDQHLLLEKPQAFATQTTLSTSESRKQNKKEIKVGKKESAGIKVKTQTKVIHKKFKKSFETQVEGKMRPIRNRIRTVNNDFVYDLLTIKEDSKQSSRITIKRSNTTNSEQNNFQKIEPTPPPLVKIIPYRLRTEPLLPVDKKAAVRGVAENVCRNVVRDGLAAPSTLPELPTERPQMRSRLISASRSDSNIVPIIGSTELEAAGLKSTFFDDSFLEKFAKKSNPSFKMKPLLAMQHSPLNSILQKFDASQQNSAKSNHNSIHNSPENNNIIPPDYSFCLLENIVLPSLKENNVSPNSKQLCEPPSPPAAPKKRITLMERLAENRAKRRDSVIRTAFEN